MHTHRKGVKARSQVRIMTLRELMQRIDPKAQEPTPIAEVRSILDKADGMPEHMVYTITPERENRWGAILRDTIGIEVKDAKKVVGITAYATGPTFLDTLENLLKNHFSIMCRVNVDEQGWRSIFICGKTEDDEPLIVCSNWYSETREVVKKRYNNVSEDASQSNNSNDTEDSEEIDLDPFE